MRTAKATGRTDCGGTYEKCTGCKCKHCVGVKRCESTLAKCRENEGTRVVNCQLEG